MANHHRKLCAVIEPAWNSRRYQSCKIVNSRLVLHCGMCCSQTTIIKINILHSIFIFVGCHNIKMHIMLDFTRHLPKEHSFTICTFPRTYARYKSILDQYQKNKGTLQSYSTFRQINVVLKIVSDSGHMFYEPIFHNIMGIRLFPTTIRQSMIEKLIIECKKSSTQCQILH